MTRRSPVCRLVTLEDGTVVRVRGDGTVPPGLEQIAAAVRARFDAECHALSAVPMPEIAQRIHSRETYWCHLPRGHEGPHSWGTRNPITWE